VPVAPPAPVAPLEALAPPLAPVAPVAPVAIVVAEPAAPVWPCSGCAEQVSLDEMACPRCGTPFMGGVSPSVSLHVPGVGDLGSMSPGGRFGFMAAGAAVITVVLFLAALVLGHLF